MSDPEPRARVFHLTTPAAWEEAQRDGVLEPPGFATEGFVHCSTLDQLVGTIERHFEGIDELVVLELDRAAVDADLRWEEGRPGEAFPHLYRPLAGADVLAVWPWTRSTDGSVALPSGLTP